MSAVLEANEPGARYLAAVQPALVRQFELLATAPGGVARLRELILTLAVQGRLVHQRRDDNSVAVLLRETELAKGSAASRKRIRLTKNDDELVAPFGLPASWAWVRLEDVTEISGGVTLGRKGAIEEPITLPYLRVANVQRWVVLCQDLKTVTIAATELARYQLRAGDLVITEGGDWDKVGRTAIWHGELPQCLHQNHVFKARGFTPSWNPEWAQLYLNSPVARAYFASCSKQTTNLASINMTQLKACAFPVPPVGEQARIVARVDELMRLCDALEAKGRLEAEQHARLLGNLLGTLTDSSTPEELAANWQRVADHFDLLLDRPEAVEALEQTILQLAVRGLLVPQDPSDETASVLLDRVRSCSAGGRVSKGSSRDRTRVSPDDGDLKLNAPLSWEEVQLSDLCTVVTDGEHATPERCDDPTQVPLVTAKNVRSESMDYMRTDFVPRQVAERCWRRCKPQKGDVLMVSVGATLGRLCILEDPVEMVLVRSVTLLRPAAGAVHVNYLALHLMSPKTQAEIWASVKQSAQPCLYLAKSAALRIALPPLREQERIVARVFELRRLCTDLRQRLTASQTTQSHLAEALVDMAVA